MCPVPWAGGLAIVWRFVTCVLELQSPLRSLLLWQMLTCISSTTSFHWKLRVTGGDVAACQRQLVDIKLIYTFRIISYDSFTKYEIEFPSVELRESNYSLCQETSHAIFVSCIC